MELAKEEAIALNKGLRKNGIAIDVVSFGEVNTNDPVLEAIVHGEQGDVVPEEDDEDASRLLRVFQGQGSIVETLSASPIVRRSGSSNGGAGNNFEFGVDPEMDPELALALKLSMEEEMARQAKDSDKKEEGEQEEEQVHDQMEIDEEEALLQQAIAMSMAKPNNDKTE